MNVSCSPVHIPTTSPHFCHPCHHKSWLSENSLLSRMRISWKPYLFSGRDCPGSRVVCCCSNHKNTFSALSIAVSGSLSYPLVGEAACALNPSSAGNLLLQVWLLPSESGPTPALEIGLRFFCFVFVREPCLSDLHLCSDRTSSFPFATGQSRVKKV